MSSTDETASSSRPKSSSTSTMTSSISQSAHTVYQWITAIAWEIYKPLFSGPTELIVPEHTRNAFFQLWCDLRTNVPKDRKWLKRHTQALKPHTLPGWIALSSAALFASAGSTAFLSMALAIFAVIMYSFVTIVLISGLFVGFSLLVVSGASIVAAMVTGWFAMCAAAAYAFIASTIAVFNYGLSIFNRTPLAQGQKKRPKTPTGKELPPASPKATSMTDAEDTLSKQAAEDRADEATRRHLPSGKDDTQLPPSSSPKTSSAGNGTHQRFSGSGNPSSTGDDTHIKPLGGVNASSTSDGTQLRPIGGGHYSNEHLTKVPESSSTSSAYTVTQPPATGLGNGNSESASRLAELLKEKVALSARNMDQSL